MKILLIAVFIFSFAFSSSAMPLVFKITKKTAGEIAVVDTSKYEKIRILATAAESDIPCAIAVSGIEETNEFSLLRTPSFKPFVLSETIDAPPAKLKFTATGDCTYTLYVYGIK